MFFKKYLYKVTDKAYILALHNHTLAITLYFEYEISKVKIIKK